MITRRQRVALWLTAGVLLALVLLVGSVLLLTQTRWGNERVLAITLSLASRQLEGQLTVQRLEGNVLTGARLFGVALRDLEGEPFLLADSAFVEYSVRTLASGQIVLRNLHVYDPEVYLRRLPGERFWNYEVIFGDTLVPPEDAPPGDREPVLLEQVRAHNALVVVQLPWEPDEELSPAAREREIEEALADTSRILVTRVPGGFVQSYRFSELDAFISQAVFAPDERGGNYLRIDHLSGIVQIWREPARLERLEGEVAILEGRIELRAPQVRLPSSRIALYGVVRPGGAGEELQFDLTVGGDEIALADLQWLYPLFPEEGGGTVTLTLESRPEGTLVAARDLVLVAPGTRLSGHFALIVGDTLRFLESDLEAAPLHIPTITGMLPTEVPVEGLRIGGAVIRAPAS